MKKLILAVLALVLSVSLAACGRNDDDMATTPPTTSPSTDMPIIPEMDPMPEANIPDPDVDTEMPLYNDGTDPANNGTNSRSGH